MVVYCGYWERRVLVCFRHMESIMYPHARRRRRVHQFPATSPYSSTRTDFISAPLDSPLQYDRVASHLFCQYEIPYEPIAEGRTSLLPPFCPCYSERL